MSTQGTPDELGEHDEITVDLQPNGQPITGEQDMGPWYVRVVKGQTLRFPVKAGWAGLQAPRDPMPEKVTRDTIKNDVVHIGTNPSKSLSPAGHQPSAVDLSSLPDSPRNKILAILKGLLETGQTR